MPWLGYLHGFGVLAEDSPPVTGGGAELLAPFLGYGVVGVLVIVLAWVLWKGSFVRSSDADKRVIEARADLLREIELVREEKQKAEDQRDAALKVAQEQLVPLLTSFVATSQSLIPLLQELVRNRER